MSFYKRLSTNSGGIPLKQALDAMLHEQYLPGITVIYKVLT